MNVHAHNGDDCEFMVSLFLFFLVKAWFNKGGTNIQPKDFIFP